MWPQLWSINESLLSLGEEMVSLPASMALLFSEYPVKTSKYTPVPEVLHAAK